MTNDTTSSTPSKEDIPIKIIAVVKFNDGEAFVLDHAPELKYNMVARSIVGKALPFCRCYFYEAPGYKSYAFAGAKFDITLEDGTVVHCFGQYWDGWTKAALQDIGGSVERVTISTNDELKKCYVYYGMYGIPAGIKELRTAYKGPVFDYWDYEKILHGKMSLHGLRKYKIHPSKRLHNLNHSL
jgi:hypothetical protein